MGSPERWEGPSGGQRLLWLFQITGFLTVLRSAPNPGRTNQSRGIRGFSNHHRM